MAHKRKAAKPRALFIKNPEAYRLAARLSKKEGLTLTAIVLTALREHEMRAKPQPIDWDKIREIQEEYARALVVDDRPADEILYDELGLPR